MHPAPPSGLPPGLPRASPPAPAPALPPASPDPDPDPDPDPGPGAGEPEAPFRRWPRVRRRWSFSALWRRVRLPVRRRRWMRENAAAVLPYLKAAEPRAEGVAVAVGDFSGENGLSRAALYELERLRREHGTVEAIDIGPAHAPGWRAVARDGPPVGTLYLLSAPDTYARVLPMLPPARIAEARRVGLWVWETPVLCEDWRFAFGVVHEIWTPSDYSRKAIEGAIEGTGTGIPVTLRPHAVEAPHGLRPFERASLGIPPRAFLGLAIMDLRSCPARKNPWAHVAAWRAAFGADPERVLVMKIRVSKRTACVREELREMIGAAGNVILLEEHMEPDAFAGLQEAADVYLSLHRAEGYGLNIREMLELGTPVVATDWSANAEYGPAYPSYRPVPFRLAPYRDWTRHYPDAGFLWAEADIAAAAAELRRIAAEAGGRAA
jgi:glycosyltransferase involved in cell wall biosynthesis